MITFATCSYTEFTPDMGLPVRISVGHPRFKLAYRPYVMPTLAPTRTILALTGQGDYAAAFRAKLDRIGVPGVRADAERVYREAGEGADGPTLVLLCFERLNEPGKWCHRTMVSEWIMKMTGETVPELGAPPAPRGAGPDFEQGTLL